MYWIEVKMIEQKVNCWAVYLNVDQSTTLATEVWRKFPRHDHTLSVYMNLSFATLPSKFINFLQLWLLKPGLSFTESVDLIGLVSWCSGFASALFPARSKKKKTYLLSVALVSWYIHVLLIFVMAVSLGSIDLYCTRLCYLYLASRYFVESNVLSW